MRRLNDEQINILKRLEADIEKFWGVKVRKPDFDEEYKDTMFTIDLPEGGVLPMAEITNFNGFARTGHWKTLGTSGIRFYVRVVGFEDARAPSRNWGKGIKSLDERWWKRRKKKGVFSYILRFLKGIIKKIKQWRQK